MLDIADFDMVETICNTGSLMQAAKVLYVSQPTLSKRLARLEQKLDTKLFHRAQTGLRPTYIAQYLLEGSAPLKAQIGSIERQVERILNHDQGELKIGVGPIIEQVLLPQVLIELANHAGKVRFSVLTDKADVLVTQLLSGQLDIIAGPFDAADTSLESHDIVSIDLVHEQTINVARAEHPIFAEDDKTNFTNYPYASPVPQGTMQRPLKRLIEHQRLTSDNYELLKSVTLASNYICGGPRGLFKKELKNQTLREIPDTPNLDWQSACLVKAESLETPLVKLFLDLLLTQKERYLAG